MILELSSCPNTIAINFWGAVSTFQEKPDDGTALNRGVPECRITLHHSEMPFPAI